MAICEKCKSTNVIEAENGSYCCNCGWDPAKKEYVKKQTNADRIREMDDEELAEFLDDLTDNCCRCAEHQNCGNCQIGLDVKTGFCDIKKWLQSEAE